MFSQPAEASRAICASVASASEVGVVHMDCTETGAPPPTATSPTRTCLVSSRGRGSRFFSVTKIT